MIILFLKAKIIEVYRCPQWNRLVKKLTQDCACYSRDHFYIPCLYRTSNFTPHFEAFCSQN